MSIIGHNSISVKKQDLINQKSTASGIRKVTFAHQASAGQTSIDLSGMTTPASFLAAGFVQATAVEIASAQLLFFRKNLLLISSARGVLQDYMTYTIGSNTSIVFQAGFTTLENEIFVGIIDGVTRSGYIGVDAVPIIATGTIPASSAAPFNVGKAFRGNFNSTQQVGDVIVYVDGQAQLRNVGNATAAPGADGNYQEIMLADGSCSQIQMNTVETYERSVLVVSSGLSILRPDGSIIQELQNLNAKLDLAVTVLADVSGKPTSYFQSAPSNVDLMAFGNRVNALEVKTGIATTSFPVGLLQAGAIPGVATNVAAAAGYVGEYLEAIGSSPAALTNGQWNDGNSAGLLLTPGEWDVQANSYITFAGNYNVLDVSICTTAGNSNAGQVGRWVISPGTVTPTADTVVQSRLTRIRVASGSTTTYYPKLYSQFTSTATATNTLTARRVR